MPLSREHFPPWPRHLQEGEPCSALGGACMSYNIIMHCVSSSKLYGRKFGRNLFWQIAEIVAFEASLVP